MVVRTKTVVVAGISGFRESVFTSKLYDVMHNLGLELEFWGWDRHPARSDEEHGERRMGETILLRGGGSANARLILWYPKWMWRVFLAALRRKEATRYFCVGFDTAFPVTIALLMRKGTLLFADTDSISKSHRWPTLVRIMLERAEKFVQDRAAVHLVPGLSRISKNKKNVRYLPNAPTAATTRLARDYAQHRGYSRGQRLTVYINGWLTPGRGMGIFLRTFEDWDPGRIHVILAGPILCKEAEELSALSCVEYLGRTPEHVALAQYYRAHVALTFYDPAIEINRLAEPNKWMDCLVTGTPFIANSEILTLRPFIENGAAFAVEYHDVQGLKNLLTMLDTDRSLLQAAARNMKHLTRPRPWDEGMEEVLREWLDKEPHAG